LITYKTGVALAAAAALGACATAPRPVSKAPAPGSATPASELAAPATAAPQEPETDYSPAALFHEAHGDFYAGMNRFKPAARVRFRGLPNGSIDSEEGEFSQWQVGGEGLLPIAVDPDSVVLAGAKFDTRRFEYGMVFGAPDPPRDETVHAAGLHVGYGHFLTDDVYAEGIFSPGVYSDFDDGLTHNDWQWYGRGLMTFRQSEELYWKLGVEVTNVFDDVPVYGLGGLAWLPGESWRIDLLLPREAELSYLAGAATTLFVGVSLEGEEYRVRSPASSGKQATDLRTQELEVYVGGIHRFSDHFSVFGSIGAVVAGDYDIQRPINDVDGQMEPTLMFEAGLGLDF
jgi:hypothetical protein